jgi:cytochrome c-type biogenesis protein CcmH
MLSLLALAMVLPALWRQRPVLAADMEGRNIALAKARLAELNSQLQSGALDQNQYDEQRLELELALGDDLDIPADAAMSAQGRWMVYVLAIAIPLLAVTLYANMGVYNYEELAAKASTPTDTANMPNQEQIKGMVAKLAERMKANPNDAEGWVMLGKSYRYLQQFPKAAEAYAEAYKLLGDQTEVMLQYADALAFANNEQMAGKPAELIFKVLAKEPDNVTALWYGGMAKAQVGEAVEAVQMWRKLVALLPPNSQARKETQTMLSNLEATVPGGVPGGAVNTETAPAASSVAVSVNVALSPDLQAATAPEDTVFIYAQAMTGPKMPLAIIRKTVADLPLSVSLSDAESMMPNLKLSTFPKVRLLARVSKAGSAMPQAGDLLGTLEDVATTDKQSHNLTINDKVK